MTNFITDDLINANVRSKWKLASNFSAPGDIPFTTVDTTLNQIGDWSTSGDAIVIPADGDYQINCQCEATSDWPKNSILGVKVNGGGIVNLMTKAPDTGIRVEGSTTLSLLAGDAITIETNGTATIDSNSATTFLIVTRIAQYSAGEPAGFALATATKAGLITNYETVTLNLDNAFSNGVIRCERINKTITISQVNSAFGAAHANGTSAETSSGLIPANFRPTASEIVNVYHMETSNVARIRIEPDGTLSTNYIDWAGSGFSRTDTGSAFTITFTRDE